MLSFDEFLKTLSNDTTVDDSTSFFVVNGVGGDRYTFSFILILKGIKMEADSEYLGWWTSMWKT